MGKNAIVGQSGGPTSVINASLAGVFESCKSRGADIVYGMCNGVAGLLEERVVDLSTLLTDDLDIELLKRTPSSFLGSCRYKLPDWRDDEAVYKKLFAILEKLNIGYFFYIRTFVSDTFIIEQYQIIGIFTAILAAYFFVKAIAYALTGWVFFDKKKNEQWMKSYLFLVSLEGLALFPMIMLQAYFGWSMQNSVVYTICLLVLFKLLTFYKSYIIFFQRMGAFLQIILYFCALEIIPLFALKGILTTIGNYLKINF